MKDIALVYNKQRHAKSTLNQCLLSIIHNFKNVKPKEFARSCYITAYHLFTVTGTTYVDGEQVPLSKLCNSIPGVFANSMYSFVSTLVALGSNENRKENLLKLLHDSFSFELLEFLNCPNIYYVYVAYVYEESYGEDSVWFNTLTEYITRGVNINTLEWESIYAHYNCEGD